MNDKHSVVKMVSDGSEFSVLSQEEYILSDVVIFVYSKDFSPLSSHVLSLFDKRSIVHLCGSSIVVSTFA